MKKIENLDFFTFRGFLRDAVIYNNMQTEEGRKWLNNSWYMGQTVPDRKTLRKTFKK